MTNKTTNKTDPSLVTDVKKTLTLTGKLSNRIIFFLIVVVILVGILTFGIMLLLEHLFHFTSSSTEYLWVFVPVSINVGIVAGVMASFWFTKSIKKAIKPYVKALQEISEGDFSTSITDDNELLRGTFVAEKFNEMVTRLRSVETLREGFISDFSHELKTPIVSISGFAKLLKDANLTEEERNEYLDVIINESDRLVNLSQSVLMLSRLDDQVAEKQPFLLDEQLRQSVLLFDKALKDKNIQLELCTETIAICSSQQLLSNVWINLLSNAIKYSPSNSSIDVVAKVDGDYIKVSFADQGCGIPAEAQPHIFNKFYQCDKSHSSEGNGLGLAIVHKVLTLVGGSIKVESELGKGSTFTVVLPK